MSPTKSPKDQSSISRSNVKITALPMEIVVKIMEEAHAVQDVLSLARTSSQFWIMWLGAHQATLLYPIIERQYSPIDDLVQVAAYAGQSALNVFRKPPITMALVKKMVSIATVTTRLAELYPQDRWYFDFENRRLLNTRELFRFRRAMYRIWLYGLAYHSPEFLRRGLSATCAADPRLLFFRHYDVSEILEMKDLHDMTSRWLYNELCPSDSTMIARYEEGTPLAARHLLKVSRSLPSRLTIDCVPDHISREAWGGESGQHRAVSDILKLTPDSLLYLREKTFCKAERIGFLRTQDVTFKNEPCQLGRAMEAILAEFSRRYGTVTSMDSGILETNNGDCDESDEDVSTVDEVCGDWREEWDIDHNLAAGMFYD